MGFKAWLINKLNKAPVKPVVDASAMVQDDILKGLKSPDMLFVRSKVTKS